VIAKYHLHPIIDHFTIALVATGIVTDMTGYINCASLSSDGTKVAEFKGSDGKLLWLPRLPAVLELGETCCRHSTIQP
jgi:hypothetical protein